jgi:hypothetical protein
MDQHHEAQRVRGETDLRLPSLARRAAPTRTKRHAALVPEGRAVTVNACSLSNKGLLNQPASSTGLCHESPSAQLSASLRVLRFASPLRVCVRAPTRGPMSLRGETPFSKQILAA